MAHSRCRRPGYPDGDAPDNNAADRRAKRLRQWMTVRDALPIEIDARDVVPVDVVLLDEGLAVPADARLVEAIELRVVRLPALEWLVVLAVSVVPARVGQALKARRRPAAG